MEEEEFLIERDYVADSPDEVKCIHADVLSLSETSGESPLSKEEIFHKKYGHRKKPKYLKFVAESKLLDYDPIEIDYISNLPYFKRTIGRSKDGLIRSLRIVATVKKSSKKDGCQLAIAFIAKALCRGCHETAQELMNQLLKGRVLWTSGEHMEGEARIFFIHDDYEPMIKEIREKKFLKQFERPPVVRVIQYPDYTHLFSINELEAIGELAGGSMKQIQRLTHAITFFQVNEGMRMTTDEIKKAFKNSNRIRKEVLDALSPIITNDKPTKTYTIQNINKKPAVG